MANKYAFVLGSHPLISFLEILNILDVKQIPRGDYMRIGEDILLIDLDVAYDQLPDLQSTLGGTIKIIEIVDEYTGTIFELNKLLTPEVLLEKYFAQTESKINFGFSVYSTTHLVYAEINWLRNFAYLIKRRLKTQHSVRYVDEKNFELSSVMVANNKLVETGAEVVIIKQDKRFMIGRTRTVQDFYRYAERDMGKPSPNAKSGMLPPKLAQMIVNLTRSAQHTQVYDPFCGSGIILQEALLLGLMVLGSDIDESAVSSTTQNLDWLVKTYNVASKKLGHPSIKHTDLEGRVILADATTSAWEKANTAQTFIAAEPYLGPPQRGVPLIHHARPIAEELCDLYTQFFTNLASNYKEITRVGFVLPVIRTNEGFLYMNVLPALAKLGFTPKEFLPVEVAKKEANATHRGGLLYSRPDQLVLREIFVFEKN